MQVPLRCCAVQITPRLVESGGGILPRRYNNRGDRNKFFNSCRASLHTPVQKTDKMSLEVEMKENSGRSKLPLPQVFLKWLDQNGLDPNVYDVACHLPRLKAQHAENGKVAEVEKDIGAKLSPVPWLPGFYSLPSEFQIASSRSYLEGKVYGMDAASGAAVAALDVLPGDHILDVCAAPGAKLCMIAELLKNSGTLTATDISPSRLAVSRTMLIKYDLGSRCRLFRADGTVFSLLPLREEKSHEQDEQASCFLSNESIELGSSIESKKNWAGAVYVNSKTYMKWKATKTAKEKKALKKLRYMDDALDRVGGRESELLFYGDDSGVVGRSVANVFQSTWPREDEASINGYDKVLVDAECTHDGSLKHISKYEQWGWDTFERRFFCPDRMDSITDLQNGFRLLKVGGTLVYSTCSFTVAQNEDVVRKFLCGESRAGCPHLFVGWFRSTDLREIEATRNWPCKPGGLKYTVRFDPVTSNTSGLFIAKIMKLK